MYSLFCAEGRSVLKRVRKVREKIFMTIFPLGGGGGKSSGVERDVLLLLILRYSGIILLRV